MSTARTSGVVGWVLAVALGASGCAPDPSLATPVGVGSTAPAMGQSSTVSPTAGVAAPTDPVKTRVVFVAVVDGDTIETSEGTVRLIGIDTPERGECGHAEAATTIGRLVSAGDPVSLELPAGQNDHDQHGRLIRYVITAAGIDLGLLQLQAGHAIARYDSTDGYPHHPRQAAYMPPRWPHPARTVRSSRSSARAHPTRASRRSRTGRRLRILGGGSTRPAPS